MAVLRVDGVVGLDRFMSFFYKIKPGLNNSGQNINIYF
jgi:hypothetical protein